MVALAVGWFLAHRLHSWIAYGPALIGGFGPSLASVLVADDAPLRRLAAGVAGVAVVLVGARWRLQSPVIVGGSALAVLALHEAVLYWDYLPRWAPLAIAGLVLVAVATTYERRLHDLNRLRTAVTRMR
jgi:hypothetical protein